MGEVLSHEEHRENSQVPMHDFAPVIGASFDLEEGNGCHGHGSDKKLAKSTSNLLAHLVDSLLCQGPVNEFNAVNGLLPGLWVQAMRATVCTLVAPRFVHPC